MSKQIDGQSLIQIIRLLGELAAFGLSSEQYEFLKESADLNRNEIDGVLSDADKAYEVIKDLAMQGYDFSGKPASKEELIQTAQTGDRMIFRVVFPSDSDLKLNEYTDGRNDLFDLLLANSEVSIGENYGLYYKSLFTAIPFVVEGDIPSDYAPIESLYI